MRKYGCLFLVAALCILASCAKEERFSSEGFGPYDMAKGFCPGFQNKVFMVPVPTGTDDTENILKTIALAQSQGPGSVVQFQKGTYKIGLIEIREFNGTIRGAGMNKTIIKPLMGLPCLEESQKTWCVALVSFIGGNIKMSDISFDIDDGETCKDEYTTNQAMGRDLYILVKFVDRVNDYYKSKDLFISAEVENVSFSGGLSEGGGAGKFNVTDGLWFGHDYTLPAAADELRTDGNLSVNNCKFSDMVVGLDIPGLKKGKATVKNSSFNNLLQPLFICDNINIESIISNNRFSKNMNYDIIIWDVDMNLFGAYFSSYSVPVKRATYKISGNFFDTYAGNQYYYPGGVSIYMIDFRTAFYPDENMPMKFMVENNTFQLHEGAKGIVGFNNKDAMILANKFTGKGEAGISLDGDGEKWQIFDMPWPGENEAWSLNNKVLGNNFALSDCKTDIYLGSFTKNCLVAGSPMAIIENYGKNNKITGNR